VPDPGLALHKALIATLDGIVDDGAAVPVFDGVPEEQAMPYVTIDFSIANRADLLVERRDERFVYLNVWSRVRGQEQVLRILAELDSRLHRAALSLETGRVASAFVQQKVTRRDSDNVTFMGRMTLRVVTEH
jgi:hypothetical protein